MNKAIDYLDRLGGFIFDVLIFLPSRLDVWLCERARAKEEPPDE